MLLRNGVFYLSLTLAYFLFANFSILAGADTAFAPSWYPNAIALLGLLTMRPQQYALGLALFGGANLLSGLSFGSTLAQAAAFVPGNMSEVLIGALCIRYFVQLDKCFIDIGNFHRLVVFGMLLPSLAGGLIASVMLPWAGISEPLPVFKNWVVGDIIGLVVMLPMLLCVFNERLYRSGDAPKEIEPVAKIPYHPGQLRFWLDSYFVVLLIGLALLAYYWVPQQATPFIVLSAICSMAALHFRFEQSTLLVLTMSAVSAWQINHGQYLIYNELLNRNLETTLAGLFVAQLLPVYIAVVVQIARARDLALNRALESAEYHRQAESRFLSNISHEIRNPLNGIKGLLQHVTTNPELQEDVKEDISHALSAARHLHALVNDILDIKKIEEGKFVIVEKSVDLHELLMKGRSFNIIAAERKGLTYIADFELDDLPRFVFADETRFFQIAANLIGNAIKFTDHGSVTERLEYTDGWLTLTVIDTGIGIDEETQKRLFNRFVQGDSSISKRFGGSGLGLMISKQIADALGGSISVHSTPGKGSTFVFSVPLRIDYDREQKRLNTSDESLDGQASADLNLAGIRILCVDDSALNLKVVSRPLIRLGADVATTLSAEEALNLIKANPYDIVLTDISMPVMNGEQLQQEIKRLRPDLPVVAITGNVFEEDVRRYLANGFSAVLEKPLDIPEMQQLIIDRVRGNSQTSDSIIDHVLPFGADQ